MWRKAFKIAAWIGGGLVGLSVATYAAAVAVNWRDRAPSPDALRLSAAYDARPDVAADDNAFIYFLGFDAALDERPRDVGTARLAWMQSGAGADPSPTTLDYLGTDPRIASFRDACDGFGPQCVAAFAGGALVFQAWAATHPWLLERYEQLIAHRGWREHVPAGISAPFPRYTGAMYGQRLWLLRAKALADAGDAAGVADVLARDQRFWRMVLESSDLVLTKMIATAALRRHLQWTSLTVRGLPADAAAAALPAEWRAPLTTSELSLRRTLVGEWMFFSGNVASVREDFEEGAALTDKLTVPLFQPQDTLNRYSAYFTELDATLDVPLADYAAATDAASQLAERMADEALPPRSLYNLMGTLLLGSAGPADFADYARRVGDLEGLRRAALATVTLRAAGTPASDMAAALAASPLRNPYDDSPLRWDADARAVVFVGLEPGERGVQRLYY